MEHWAHKVGFTLSIAKITKLVGHPTSGFITGIKGRKLDVVKFGRGQNGGRAFQ